MMIIHFPILTIDKTMESLNFFLQINELNTLIVLLSMLFLLENLEFLTPVYISIGNAEEICEFLKMKAY
jgi:hypothetical protein